MTQRAPKLGRDAFFENLVEVAHIWNIAMFFRDRSRTGAEALRGLGGRWAWLAKI